VNQSAGVGPDQNSPTVMAELSASPSASSVASLSSAASLFGLRETAAAEAATRVRAQTPEPAPAKQEPFNTSQYLLWHKRALLQRSRVGNGR
jgi:hypothetical protein